MAKSGILAAGSRALGYDIITLLGSGQFGEVYEAFDSTMGRTVALKLIEISDPSTHKAEVEAQAQYLCAHDNVVKINSANEIAAGPLNYLVIDMEYIADGSLEDRIKASFIGCKEAVYHIKQILFALEHAHHREIVHRDVKPGNILLAKPRSKLSDFGTVIYPATGRRVIDKFYIPHAPPEALNNDDFSPLCDIYAAGITLLRAVNNITDWSACLAGMDWRRLAGDGKLAGKVGFKAYVPRSVRTIVNRACNRDPSKRYSSAAAFRGDLEKLRFANDWIRKSPDEWICEKAGRIEAITVEATRRIEAVYKINGRRHNAYCRTCSSVADAQDFAEKIVYKTTLA